MEVFFVACRNSRSATGWKHTRTRAGVWSAGLKHVEGRTGIQLAIVEFPSEAGGEWKRGTGGRTVRRRMRRRRSERRLEEQEVNVNPKPWKWKMEPSVATVLLLYKQKPASSLARRLNALLLIWGLSLVKAAHLRREEGSDVCFLLCSLPVIFPMAPSLCLSLWRARSVMAAFNQPSLLITRCFTQNWCTRALAFCGICTIFSSSQPGAINHILLVWMYECTHTLGCYSCVFVNALDHRSKGQAFLKALSF